MEGVSEPGHTCGICKVTYATDVELEDHNWSLMHHIKIEKLKKGAPHSCNLCMESCANIIEYGKHLNDDRHKLALSRRAKEGTELLDSFASQSGLLSKERDIPPELEHPEGPDFLEGMEHKFQGRKYHRGQGPPVSKHKRSFSQPDIFTEKPPYLMDIDPFTSQPAKGENVDNWLNWVERDKAFNKHIWQKNDQSGEFKVPHGRPGHSRTNSDMRPNYHVAEREMAHYVKNTNPDHFYNDNFQDINWSDNTFYSQRHGNNIDFVNDPYHWHGNGKGENSKNSRARRGSFDSNRYINGLQSNSDNRHDFEEDIHTRGRGAVRKNRGAGRSHSYDNNSPESTSSSDSSLKRRLEFDDSSAPGRTRRRLGPYVNNSPTSSTCTPEILQSLIGDNASKRPRGRSSSRDRYNGKDLDMLDTDRPASRSLDKKVSWSDQQQVSSTTETVIHSPKGKAKSGKGKRIARSKSPMLPDSSSESELSKTSKINERGKKKSGHVKAKTSPRTQRKTVVKDSTETVLEKAERLCKKLRNEREKAKHKKQTEEKKKKFEKQQEINDKIETLSERNKANITGVLDGEIVQFTNKELQDEFLKFDGTTEYSCSSGIQTQDTLSAAELHRTQLIPEKLVNVSKPSSGLLSHDSVKTGNTSASLSEKIAQTRADIDSIRAKIESSVNTNLTTVNKDRDSVLSPTRQLTDTSTSQGRYLQPSGTNSLLKMVNSPRTTKERNQLAQMLREHAKSQKKLSLPRFNLKYSDLCSNSDRQDEQVNIDTLAPSVQLEIANIIEADVKPDIAQLEKLLENASAENAELDMNILSDLGVSSPARRTSTPVMPSTLSLNFGIESYAENEMQLHDRISSPLTPVYPDRNWYLHEKEKTDKLKQQEIKHERSRSPILKLFPREGMSRNLKENEYVTTVGDELGQERADRVRVREVKEIENADSGQGLNIEDLSIRFPVDYKREKLDAYKTRNTETGYRGDGRFASSLPVSSGRTGSSGNLSASVSLPSSGVRIKQEKPDDDYEQAVNSALSKAKAFINRPTEESGTTHSRPGTPSEDTPQGQGLSNENLDSRQTDKSSGRFSPVRMSIHTQNLYRKEESPVRDSEKHKAEQSENDARSTLEKVTSILDGVPAPRVESGGDKSSSTTPTEAPVPRYIQPKEKHLDSSLNSQASILEEVYSVSIQEESVRQEISSVDMKISKLKSLIEEASQELRKCSHEKEKLVEQESSYRSKRLKLLEESRSSSAGSQTTANDGLLGNLSQMELENPMLLKFLMSQRQSDVSSVGYSNVESGSQPDSERNQQRRCSLTSNISESVSVPTESQNYQESQLFSKSIDALSGSSDTMLSVLLKATADKTEEQKQNDSGTMKMDPPDNSINSTNSISMLNKPLERVGFVTLDTLMKGGGDLGKLLNKSLESIEKGTIPEGASPLHKQTDNDSKGSSGAGLRERRDSTFSIDTGSDSERKSVSLKYMGTLPEGTDYESIVRQVSQKNRNKSLMITVLSSPEAMSQLKRTPDAGSTPVVRPKEEHLGLEIGYKSDGSSRTNSTHTLTHLSDVESQSARSTFSLGEQIKRMCDDQNIDVETPTGKGEDSPAQFSGKSESKDLELRFEGKTLSDLRNSSIKDCFVRIEKLDLVDRSSPKTVTQDVSSPVKKKLKSKKERDQMSRRKQKESFILQSDTNSDGENESLSSSKFRLPTRPASKSEEDLVQTGSEDRTPRPVEVSEMKRSRSLLDEVQLETETPSDSCEDRSQTAGQKQSGVHYRGPSLSVAAIQEFKGDLYICYNGSEVRRFELKTGRILKELDCSPYLVNCLHVTSVIGRGDILYTGGTCKKLMLFEPQKFGLHTTVDYSQRLTCLHENWGRLFIGLSDGGISVRSLKTDKELNCFSCTTTAVHSLGTSSAGMTKMLCLATGDKVIYVLDAITGLLITMLEGHTQPPRCLQVCGDKVISGGSDLALTLHSITTGALCKMTMSDQTVTNMWCDSSTIYTANCDNVVRTYNFDLKPGDLLQTTGKEIVTCGIVKDRMVIVGKRDGGVEAVHLDKLRGWNCKFGNCSLQFSVFSHFRLHVLSEHVNDKASHCTYTDCNHIFTKQDRRQDHVLSHLK